MTEKSVALPVEDEMPHSYEDMLARPGFQETLDDRAHQLQSILMRYRFNNVRPCGRNGCRQPHKNGFLVRTVDGLETNIGSKCGENTFGKEVWAFKQNEFSQMEQVRLLIDRAVLLLEERVGIAARITGLYKKSFGFSWQKILRDELVTALGSELLDALVIDQRRQNWEVKVSYQLTSEERATRQTQRKVGYVGEYEERIVGRLVPMPWLVFNPNERLIKGVRDQFNDFEIEVFKALPTPKKRKFLKRFEGTEDAFREAEEACLWASRFLDEQNLELLAQWIPSYKAQRKASFDRWRRGVSVERLRDGNVSSGK